ncbi:MAG: transcriptional regulator [Gammaproteobacteria bacterium RIFCSPLOWO2_02_FULL_61_13]|nr:MAG: transcriptional regulator [Gammaproteobacteria bacterium RIFCSPLOWO2_02_FULL_61_13]
MALTRDYKDSIRNRSESDPKFAASLMKEALTAFISGEPETARVILRELVNSTIGFELLSAELDKPSKSVHRMLSARGNPTMDNLTNIFVALQKELDTDVQIILAPHNISPKADSARRRRLA